MTLRRSFGILAGVVVVVLTAGCFPHPDPDPPPVTPTPTPTWTFTTNQTFCPEDGWHGATHWVAMSIETTVFEEAEIGTETGMCASQDDDQTYLINTGNTAWSIDPSDGIEHFYLANAPALLLPLRDEGAAIDILGPHETALIATGPEAITWSIDVPMTMTASTVGEMTDYYGGKDFVFDVLEGWKRRATQKGSPNKLLATCADSAYQTANEEWSASGDVQSVLADVTAGLEVGKHSADCLGAVFEYDDLRRADSGLEPRVSPLLRARTFQVTGERLASSEEALKLAGSVLRLAH